MKKSMLVLVLVAALAVLAVTVASAEGPRVGFGELWYDGEVVRTRKEWDSRTVKGPQLFDLSADPHEKHNVAASKPEVVACLAQRIADWYPVTKRKTEDAVEPR